MSGQHGQGGEKSEDQRKNKKVLDDEGTVKEGEEVKEKVCEGGENV
ncbi:hypothetical protein [Staphylococcus capitis]|nr:hypothetical protein [Staphylococcus capitis]